MKKNLSSFCVKSNSSGSYDTNNSSKEIYLRPRGIAMQLKYQIQKVFQFRAIFPFWLKKINEFLHLNIFFAMTEKTTVHLIIFRSYSFIFLFWLRTKCVICNCTVSNSVNNVRMYIISNEKEQYISTNMSRKIT